MSSEVQIAVIDQQDTQIVLAVPGVQGATGSEIAAGGTANQVLRKASSTNYDTNWSLVTNAMVDSSAAIAGTKISPNFGSQNVVTTGTSTAASFIPTSSSVPTNGVYLPSANNVAISTNGTGRLFVDSTGRILVGYTSGRGATATQHIYGIPTGTSYFEIRNESTSGQGDILFSDGTGGNYGIVGYDHSTDAFRIYTASSERLRVDSSGRLGLGTSSPGSKLEIRNDVAATTSLDTTFIKLLNGLDGGSGIEFANAVAGKAKISFGVESVGTGTDDTYIGFSTCFNAGALTERVRVNSSGNVGIGTTSASSLLTLRSTAGNNTAGINMQGATSGNITSIYDTFSDFVVEHAGGEAFRVDASQRLLVGTSSDSGGALLQVNGDRVRIATAKTPASASDTGTTGEICWDANYVYVCTATNTWKRSAISTW